MISVNRWVYLITGSIALLFLGLIYAWSIFRAPFTALYPQWSISELSMTFTISMVFFCIGGFSSGQLMKRFKPMHVLCLSALFLFAGFWGVSMIQGAAAREGLRMLYLFYGFFCGGGVGIGYNCVISTVNKWFSDRAGLSSGILMMGFGFGGLLFGGAVKVLIEHSGLFSTFRTLAFAAVILLTAASLFMKLPQSGFGGKGQAAASMKSFTTKEMLADAKFWLFILWSVMVNAAGLIIIGSAASIAAAFGAPALLGLMVSVFNGAGRVLIGSIYDRYKRSITILTVTMLILCAGSILTAGALTGSSLLILIGLLITGMGYGGGPAVTSAFVHSEFGPKYFPVNFSIGTFSLVPAAIIGPMISSFLIERAGGSYSSTFVMIVVLGLLALIVSRLIDLKAR